MSHTATAADFLTAVKARRSYYAIGKESPVSDERIHQLIEEAVKHTPSAFNSQSTRIVLLLGAQHDKLWDMTENVLRGIVGDESKFQSTKEKMDSFRNGHGTVLFFEDQEVVRQLQQQFALYKDNFPVWSEHASAMHQFVVWTSLEAEGLGASLQHYNPIIDDEVKRTWNLPDSWKLIAQMPFGKPLAAPGEKEFQPLEQRVKVFK
ncbi:MULTISPECIES: nitroreductase family protein [Cohnella]|uniref:nitroreductase family protein n=1 Tax=Cohnella TaxID=329857 RepID=UPI0009B9F819|nr:MULTISPECIES: nitroreductase family protein [Cohnella]MBN2984327.1 nitroreductase family protein [Cohnella algarum]